MQKSNSCSQSDVFRKTEKKLERTDTVVKMKLYSAWVCKCSKPGFETAIVARPSFSWKYSLVYSISVTYTLFKMFRYQEKNVMYNIKCVKIVLKTTEIQFNIAERYFACSRNQVLRHSLFAVFWLTRVKGLLSLPFCYSGNTSHSCCANRVFFHLWEPLLQAGNLLLRHGSHSSLWRCDVTIPISPGQRRGRRWLPLGWLEK